jgi:phosphopantothenoylcysteine decarboxylase/phosphopantothenate--cysteine ligase
VLTESFNPDDGEWNSHIELGLWADLMLIAPASANTLAKMATGVADNMLLTTYLSARCPVFFAPAMDLDMYRHPTTKANIEKLQSYGNHLIKPTEGVLASGLCGEGRMEEPEKILETIKEFFKKEWDFPGKNILVTAGPTFENIDPVRFIGNYSSGLMGYAIANEFAERGGVVTLISGPSSLEATEGVKTIKVQSAAEMHEYCMKHFDDADIIIMAAAVADYTPEQVAGGKIKKDEGELLIKLKPTADILAEMGSKKREDQFLVGFALETENTIANAEKKLKKKNLDLIVANSASEQGAGFGVQTNKVSMITKDHKVHDYELKLKFDVAVDIADKIRDLTT